MAVLFEDTFTDANGVLLDAHIPTPGPGTWVQLSNAGIEIQDNTAQSTARPRNSYVTDVGASDCVISFDITQVIAGTSIGGVSFRNTDNIGNDGTWRAVVYQTDGAARIFELSSQRAAGTGGTLLGSHSVTLLGQDITFDYNGGSISYGGASQNETVTTHGPWLDRADCRMDNFKVTDFATGTDVTLNWTDQSTDETGFEIQRSAGATEPADWSVVPVEHTTLADVQTWLDSGVSDGDYWYRVTAINAAGNSGDAAGDTNIESITLGSVGPAVLILDEFTDTPGTALVGRTPTIGAGPWVSLDTSGLSNGYQIAADGVTLTRQGGVSGYRGPYIDSGAADCVVSMDIINEGSASNIGLLVRQSSTIDASVNWWMGIVGDNLEVRRLNSTVGQTALTGGKTGTLVVTLDGGIVDIQFNADNIHLTGQTVGLTDTYHGTFMRSLDSSIIADNFKVTELP